MQQSTQAAGIRYSSKWVHTWNDTVRALDTANTIQKTAGTKQQQALNSNPAMPGYKEALPGYKRWLVHIVVQCPAWSAVLSTKAVP